MAKKTVNKKTTMKGKKLSPQEKILAENIKKFRLKAKLTQEQLCKKAKVSPAVVGILETRGSARTNTVIAIASGLGVPPAKLFAGM